MSAAVAVTLSRADSDTLGHGNRAGVPVPAAPPQWDSPGIRVAGQDDSMIKVPETPSETLPASRSAAVSGGQASRTNITGRLAALDIWKVGSCYVTCYITGGVLHHTFMLYNMLNAPCT